MPKRGRSKNVQERSKTKRQKIAEKRHKRKVQDETDFRLLKKKRYDSVRQQIQNLFAGGVGGGAVAGPSSMFGAAYTDLMNTATGITANVVSNEPLQMLSMTEAAAGEVGGAVAGADVLADLAIASTMGPAFVAGAIAAGALTAAGVSTLFTQQKEDIESFMSGTYQGKLAVLGRKEGKSVKSKFEKNGAVYINEIYGNVQDVDMVGVGHGSFDLLHTQWAISLALLRKLFRKAGFDVNNPRSVLPLSDMAAATANQFHVRWSMIDADGTVTYGHFNIPLNASLVTVADGGGTVATSVREVIYQMITAANPAVLESIGLFSGTQGASTGQVAILYMKREVLHLACHSHIVVQNRTKAASGAADAGSTSTTQVDAQPLKGPVYEFSGVPKTKSVWTAQMNESNTDGTYLVRPSSFPAGNTDDTAWKEPPTKKMFSNAIKGGFTRLNPGQMKDMAVVDYHKGFFQHLLSNKLRVVTENNKVVEVPGRFQVVFLEEELNSGSLNKISVQYECQHTTGAEFITTKSPIMANMYGATNRDLNS